MPGAVPAAQTAVGTGSGESSVGHSTVQHVPDEVVGDHKPAGNEEEEEEDEEEEEEEKEKGEHGDAP